MCGKYVKPRIRKPLKTIADPLRAAAASALNWIEDYSIAVREHGRDMANNYENRLAEFARSPAKQEAYEIQLREWYSSLEPIIPRLREIGAELRRIYPDMLQRIMTLEVFSGPIQRRVESIERRLRELLAVA